MSDVSLPAGLRLQARRTTRRAARTFSLACRLLPRDIRDDVYMLYLVFRTLDDLVDDGAADADERVAAVERWCRSGVVSSPESAILAGLAERHPLPRPALLDFCAGMRDDLDGSTPDDEEAVDRYAYRVAGTVGLVMSGVLGVRGRPDEAAAAARALGIAMQRTNILRDIDEDRAAGRSYIAASAVARHGPPLPGRRAALLREQIAIADRFYDEGIAGIDSLRQGRVAIRVAAAMYREILRELEREGLGERAGRAVVPTRRKLLAGLRALR